MDAMLPNEKMIDLPLSGCSCTVRKLVPAKLGKLINQLNDIFKMQIAANPTEITGVTIAILLERQAEHVVPLISDLTKEQTNELCKLDIALIITEFCQLNEVDKLIEIYRERLSPFWSQLQKRLTNRSDPSH